MIQRVLNHRTMKDGKTKYLVKWRDLSYDQSTWEDDTCEVPAFKKAVEYYWVKKFDIFDTSLL